MTTAHASEQVSPGQPIPTPANFPVAWEQPDDARWFWTRDRLHVPGPVTPMTGAFLRYVFEDAFNAAAEAYALPVRAQTRRCNSYFYSAMVPVAAPPAPIMRMMSRLRSKSPHLVDRLLGIAMASQSRRTQARLEAVVDRLDEVWTSEFLPEIKQHLAYWQEFDLRGAAMPVLLAHLEATIARTKRLWELHFRLMFPVQLARSMFDDLYHVLFGQASVFDSYRLLQGFDNKILAADRALWYLSRKALADPQVRRVLEAYIASDVLAALESSSAGQAFLAELHAFLHEYGRRSDHPFELSRPSWIEDLTPVINILKDYIAQPDRDPTAEMVALAAERERLLAEARTRLQGYPRQTVDQFEHRLKAAQAAAVIGEDHNFWIDLRSPYEVRRVLLEFGRRLSETGVLDQADDIFYLTFDEVCEIARALPQLDRRQLIAGRRAELAYFRTIVPPPALGTEPLLPPPDMPLLRAIGKFLGTPPQPSIEPAVVRGHAGSPGVARGPAKVIRSLTEAGKLETGDVLVAETTATAWTPLFAIAAAVVTDTGGILSHGAIVAREYGIPAVVGTGIATHVIRDGYMLEVDGDTGIVRVVATI